MSVWNPDNIRDVAESVGITNLNHDVTENLARDVEYRVAQVLEEALKCMRHGKRTLLTTQDISHALRNLDVEPLYGYESLRPLRFGEASLGPGQPLFYVEDEEVDFEKLINAPLPKVPREVSFTGKYIQILAVIMASKRYLPRPLARRRGCPAIHTSEPHCRRFSQPRAGLEGTQRQFHPCGNERYWRGLGEAYREARAVQGAAAVL